MKKWIPQTGWLLALGLAIICLVLIFEVSNRIHLESLLRADPAQLDKHRDRSEIPTERPLLLLTGDSRARDLGSTKIGEYHVENRGIPGPHPPPHRGNRTGGAGYTDQSRISPVSFLTPGLAAQINRDICQTWKTRQSSPAIITCV